MTIPRETLYDLDRYESIDARLGPPKIIITMTPEYVIPRDVSSGFALEFKSSYDQIVSHLGAVV